MRGTGRATGAITFLNALTTGVGAAAGIQLGVTASLDLSPGRGASEFSIAPEADTPLVRASLEAALRQWAPARSFRGSLAVRSEIPLAKGLKSSSAVSGAVARSVASALQVFATNEEIGRLSADVSQSIGLSATGAFDDALAALEPGAHVTQNAQRRRLRTDAIDPAWQVILWIPRTPHLPSPTYREAFRRLAQEGRNAEAAARAGDMLSAMRLNTEIVERALGYPYAELRARMADRGALGAGVSGNGPTLAAIAPPEGISGVLASLPAGEAEIIVSRFSTSIASSAAEAS